MKKTIGLNKKFMCLFIGGLIAVGLIFSGSVCAAENTGLSAVGALERAIHSLIDPFISKAKLPPEPVLPPKPSEPMEFVSFVPSEQVIPKPIAPVIMPPPVVAPNLLLTGIIFNANRSMAIVNGEVIDQGQVITVPEGKVKIVKINKNSIDIQFLGKSFTIATDQGE